MFPVLAALLVILKSQVVGRVNLYKLVAMSFGATQKSSPSVDVILIELHKDDPSPEFDVSMYLMNLKTVAHINNYGVTRDESKLFFSGICHIINGAHESKAHQNSKIMVFDEHSDAVAKPILKIDDNDIEASHAAVVGKISDDHMFYLTSKGLSENEARELITYGYLKPILNGFDDEKLQERISSLIEGGI